MKLLNYVKPLGAFTNAGQLIALDPNPSDRQVRKMLEEAQQLVAARIARHIEYVRGKAAKEGTTVDEDAERDSLTPKVVDGKILMPLQYLQDYMTRKIAAVQNNVSIHDKQDVAELREVFSEYGVELIPTMRGLVFEGLGWSARPGQKPKLMVMTKAADGEAVVIRFEAAGELCQKFMNAALALDFKPGTVFDLAVEAVDPAIERNKRQGKEVVKPGVYVNHNLKLSVGAERFHTGHPEKGTKFMQKPTLEQMESLYQTTRARISA